MLEFLNLNIFYLLPFTFYLFPTCTYIEYRMLAKSDDTE